MSVFFLSKEWLHIEVVGMIIGGILKSKMNEETLRATLKLIHQREET